MSASATKTGGVPVVGAVLRSIFGTRNERFVKRFLSRVEAINAFEPEMRGLTDAELRARTQTFRDRLAGGARSDEILIEAFAVGREAMDRAVGLRNAFNPEKKFDSSRLPEDVRALYESTKAEMESREPAESEGPYLGEPEAVSGWRQVDIPVEVYEAIRELHPESRPPFRARPFDVQLVGAMVLYQGKIAEMKTGEGKTIVAPLACYLAALEGLSCHVVTVNDYLVQRDRDWVAPFYTALGMTVGAIHPSHSQPEQVKRQMYQCDVVYGTTSEFGFDYLRDNMKRSVEQQVQRQRDFAIVDEVDSILIDEARTPLIISGPAFDDQPRYELADKLARHLVEKQRPWAKADEDVQACRRRIKGLEGDIRNARDASKKPAMQRQLEEARSQLPGLEAARDQHIQYYEVEMDKKQAHLTHHGIEEAQKVAQVGSFYVGDNIDVPHLMEQAIRAHVVYERDRDYIVMPLDNPQTGRKEPSVVIVDVFTGRPMIGRQWSDGLHQAVEAKEQVPIKQETQTVATITIQNFFKMYQRLAGMTGTADTEAQEFHDIYRLDVVVIPTNKPVIREDFDDTLFLTAKDKWDTIVDEIKAFHDVGRPVLVGTTSVEKSETLAQMLMKKHGVRHEVLNAKQHEREAHIVENAGQLGAVMIATNMAGRGTDIKLARIDREELLDHWRKRGLAPSSLTASATDEDVREAVYRKIAPKELGLSKKDVQDLDFADLELRLLRLWTTEHTWIDPRKADRMTVQELRDALDEHGRFLLHRIGWVDSIEQLGGLHVVGTERHESRRIDNQLRGRSGRQGDRGSSRFFVSLEDDLMKLFAGETTMKVLARLGMKEGDSIEHPMLSKSVERAQRKVEERNFQIRKNILEYDEIREVQRRKFYTLRQRVLDGRDIKGVIFENIEEAVADAVNKYLDRDYSYECVAEHARQKLALSIPHERLRGRDRTDIVDRLQGVARDEAGAEIGLTVGEYMPDDALPEDYDLTALSNWASKELEADLKPSEMREMTRRDIEEALLDAATDKIERTDLTGVLIFMEEGYGVSELCRWAKGKFGVEIDPGEITAELEKDEGDPVGLITGKAHERYEEREVVYPVTFALEMTSSLMQQDPDLAAKRLVRWANVRYGMGWDESVVRTKTPQQVQRELLDASKRFVESDALDQHMRDALACIDDDALENHVRERYDIALPDRIRGLEGEAREDAIRALVEGVLRSEMIQFERVVLLDTLDSAWKDHLREMDHLQGAIGFRSFSQQDPRIEFKREGSRLYEHMEKVIRDRVTEYVFKLRLSPAQSQQPQQRPPQRPPMAAAQGQPQGQQAPAGSPPQGRDHYQGAEPATNPQPGVGFSSITGPGFSTAAAAPPQRAAERSTPPDQAPATTAKQTSRLRRAEGEARQAEASQEETSQPQQRPEAKREPIVNEEPKVGRNDPCPCGSGLKYKKCCGAPGGAAATEEE